MTAPAGALLLAARALPRRRRDLLTLAGRPGSPVVHVFIGPATPSGRFAAAGGRTVCNARTRRLTIVPGSQLLDHGRRACGRCVTRIDARAGRVTQPVNRSQHLEAYTGTTLRELAVALTLATTIDDTHKVGFLAQLLYGAPPVRRPAASGVPQAVYDLHAAIVAARRRFIAANRTPEEIAAIERDREDQAHNDAITRRARAQQARVDRAIDRRARGGYMTAGEKELLGMTG